MFELNIKKEFSSAHRLREYRGKCEALHGHNWRVEVSLASGKLDKIGMVMDFKKVKEALNGVLSKLDHTYLNELGFFKKINPTSENIARYIFDDLKKRIKGVKVAGVTVWETDSSAATYSE